VWGSTYLGTAVTVESVEPLLGSGIRFLVAGGVLAVILALTRGRRALAVTRREAVNGLLLGVGLLGVGVGTVAAASRYVPTGVEALLFAATAVFAILIRALNGDRPARLTVLGVVIGLAGLAFMLLPGGTTPVSGTPRDVVIWSAAIVGCSAVWAFMSWLAPRIAAPRDAWVMTTYQLVGSGVALTTVGLLIGERVSVNSISTSTWIAFIYLVIIGSLGAYTAFVWLLDHAPLSLVSTYAYVNPVVAVALGALLHHEGVTLDVVVGCTVVVGAVALVITGENRARVRVSAGSAPD
jgi:drug/metabolite transporter (DMT)-like permease